MVDLVYPPIIATARVGFRLMGQRFQVTGAENIPRTGGAVLALNHISYVDFVYGGLAAVPSKRLVRFMAKRELFDHKVVGPLMRSLHHISVDRADGIGSYHEAVAALQAGELVGIFPEATISRSLELKDFKSGAVRLAAAADVPLIPAVLWGTQRMLTKDHPRDFSRGTTIAITVGTPLQVAADEPTGETARLRAAMATLLEQTIADYPAAEQPPGSWWLPASHGGTAPTPVEAIKLDAAEKRARIAELRAKKSSSR